LVWVGWVVVVGGAAVWSPSSPRVRLLVEQ